MTWGRKHSLHVASTRVAMDTPQWPLRPEHQPRLAKNQAQSSACAMAVSRSKRATTTSGVPPPARHGIPKSAAVRGGGGESRCAHQDFSACVSGRTDYISSSVWMRPGSWPSGCGNPARTPTGIVTLSDDLGRARKQRSVGLGAFASEGANLTKIAKLFQDGRRSGRPCV